MGATWGRSTMSSVVLGRVGRYVAALTLAIAAFTGQPGWAQQLEAVFPGGDPPGRVGRLSFVSTAASVRTYGDAQWSPAIINYPITTGTSVWTEPGALAEINIGDAAIRLDNATEIEFIALDDEQVHAFVKQGGVNVQIRSLQPGDRFQISTPRGTVSFSGRGYYRVDAGTEDQPTRVAALSEGSAQITGDGPTLVVHPGGMALITGIDDLRYEVVAATPDAFDRWAMARDPLDRALRRAHYVPSEVTGYEDLDQYGTWSVEPDYGPVWYPTTVPAAWVPYSFGAWVFVWPWGWTWIDNAPWGFAPFHYGRWVLIRSKWCWLPGHHGRRPVFAPALVKFVGGTGTAIGWFPLGPRDRFKPWYKASERYAERLNVDRPDPFNGNNPNFRDLPNRQWATVVDQNDFVRGRPVRGFDQRRRSPGEIAQAPMMDLKPDALPRPQRDNERVQRVVGTPPPVNLRSGPVPGWRRPAEANTGPRIGNPATPSQNQAAPQGAPAPRSAPFNQERFERFRDRNPAAFGTPPGQPPRQQNPVDMTPRQQPRAPHAFEAAPQRPPEPTPRSFQPGNVQPRDDSLRIQRSPPPQVESPRPPPQVQHSPPPQPRQEYRAPPQQQHQQQQQPQRGGFRNRDGRNGI
jgi:hypothetical protein